MKQDIQVQHEVELEIHTGSILQTQAAIQEATRSIETKRTPSLELAADPSVLFFKIKMPRKIKKAN